MSINLPSSKSLVEDLKRLVDALKGAVMPVRAHAKVNLRLKVLGRRSDGYHLLSMLNCNASLCDELGISFKSSPEIDLTVDPTGLLDQSIDSNLAVRAFKAFWSEFGFESPPVGLSCFISKRISIGAGLGGGSGDAAAVLRALTATFGEHLRASLRISASDYDLIIRRAALGCGADVPYSYVGGACWVSGIGEQIREVDIKDLAKFEIVIMVPNVPVPTVAFYERFRAAFPVIAPSEDRKMERFISGVGGDLIELIENDFEACVCDMVPEVANGLRLARELFPRSTALTGSGCAFFSIASQDQADRVQELLSSARQQGLGVYQCSFV